MQISSILVLVAAAATAQAANNVPEHIVYSAKGSRDIVANGFGCVNITPTGAGNHNCCVKRIFSDGFTVNIEDQKAHVTVQCSIKGFEGTCGASNIAIKVTPFGTETGNAPPPTGPAGLPNQGKFSHLDTTQPKTVRPKAGTAQKAAAPAAAPADAGKKACQFEA